MKGLLRVRLREMSFDPVEAWNQLRGVQSDSVKPAVLQWLALLGAEYQKPLTPCMLSVNSFAKLYASAACDKICTEYQYGISEMTEKGIPLLCLHRDIHNHL